MTYVTLAEPPMTDGIRPVARYKTAVFAYLAIGTPPDVLAQTDPDSTVGRKRIQPLPALGSFPETGFQFGATVLAVIDRPALDHARTASIIATALRSTKSQTRSSVEGEAIRHFDIALSLTIAKVDAGIGDGAHTEVVLARAHRILLMVHLWSGPAHRAWAHARSAVALAEQSGERKLAWSAHWSGAVLAALTAHTSARETHLREATRRAGELNSPLLELRTLEIAIEYRAGTDELNRAIMDGERAIAVGRALDQTTLLARLLYWVSGVYLQRGDFTTAKRLIYEAWEVSGAADLDLDRPFEVHGVLPACVARTAYLSAVGEHAQALALATDDGDDRRPYGVHRLGRRRVTRHVGRCGLRRRQRRDVE